jgi:sarcosine oxidase subunit delta
VAYPEHPEELTDRDWAEYLFYRQNTKGLFAERWMHSAGCRKWFNMLRDTVSYDITAVYRIGEQPPAPRPMRSKSGTAANDAHLAALEGAQP